VTPEGWGRTKVYIAKWSAFPSEVVEVKMLNLQTLDVAAPRSTAKISRVGVCDSCLVAGEVFTCRQITGGKVFWLFFMI
jgi:hypothetical protein